MKKLENLCQQYPDAFAGEISPRSPFPLFGFECEDGWYDLLEPVIKFIDEFNKANPKTKIAIAQIKEKFGTLRFYTHHGTDELYKLIHDAETRSSETCETCGQPGKLQTARWIYTACEAHVRTETK